MFVKKHAYLSRCRAEVHALLCAFPLKHHNAARTKHKYKQFLSTLLAMHNTSLQGIYPDRRSYSLDNEAILQHMDNKHM